MGLRNIIIFIITISIVIIPIFYGSVDSKPLSNETPLETKISQMIVIGYDCSEAALENLKKNITDKNISGVIFYKRNIKNPIQIKNQISQFNALSSKKYPKEPVLVGHVINGNIDSKNISSLSSKTIYILDNTMKHEGIVLADAVDMSSVEDYDIKEILSKAINSGVNLFIFPNHVKNTSNSKIYMEPEYFIKIVTEAVNSGKIKMSKIDDSYKKITDLKQRYLIDGNI